MTVPPRRRSMCGAASARGAAGAGTGAVSGAIPGAGFAPLFHAAASSSCCARKPPSSTGSAGYDTPASAAGRAGSARYSAVHAVALGDVARRLEQELRIEHLDQAAHVLAGARVAGLAVDQHHQVGERHRAVEQREDGERLGRDRDRLRRDARRVGQDDDRAIAVAHLLDVERAQARVGRQRVGRRRRRARRSTTAAGRRGRRSVPGLTPPGRMIRDGSAVDSSLIASPAGARARPR